MRCGPIGELLGRERCDGPDQAELVAIPPLVHARQWGCACDHHETPFRSFSRTSVLLKYIITMRSKFLASLLNNFFVFPVPAAAPVALDTFQAAPAGFGHIARDEEK